MNFKLKKNIPNQEMELTKLKKEIEFLKLKKERELVLAQTTKQKQQLLNEINSLKKAQKNPSNFKKNMSRGLKIVGKGLATGFKEIQTASNNMQRDVAYPKEISNPNSPFSKGALMFLPKVKKPKKIIKKVNTPTKKPTYFIHDGKIYQTQPQIKPKNKVYQKQKRKPRARLETINIQKQSKHTYKPWELP